MEDIVLVAKGCTYRRIDDVSNAIEGRIVAGERDSTESPTKFYMSQAGFICPRKRHYDLLGGFKPSPALKRIFLAGDMTHEFIQGLDYYAGYSKEVRTQLHCSNFMFSGRIDLIDYKEIVEIKSVEKLEWVRSPYKSHLAQLQIYLESEGYDTGILSYVSRVNLRTKEFVIERDDDLINEIISKHEILAEQLQSMIFPDKKKYHGCRNCDYKDVCDANYYLPGIEV